MSKSLNESTNPKPIKHAQDFKLTQSVLRGVDDAAHDFEVEYRPLLIKVMMAKGLNQIEAEDLVADILAECFGVGKKGRTTSLLRKFEGRSSLSTWLITVTWRRWLDLKRREKKIADLPSYDDDDMLGDKFDRLPAENEELLDEDLRALMQNAIKASFDSLDPDTLLMLKLYHLHGINQMTLAKMWQTDQTRVSRTLSAARKEIAEVTMSEIRTADPDIQIDWEDFKRLCEVGLEW